jgi:sugar lactone lactonase YvrE
LYFVNIAEQYYISNNIKTPSIMKTTTYLSLIGFIMLLPLMVWGQQYNVTTITGGVFHDGPASEAKFNYPSGTVMDRNGNLYVADAGNNCIRKIDQFGGVTTIAGTGRNQVFEPLYLYRNGNDSSAKFASPSDIAIDRIGNLYIADMANHAIRKISPNGNITTIAGSGIEGFRNGNRTQAQFNYPAGLAVDVNLNIYVADKENHNIRKISASGQVTTIAGSGYSGFRNGVGSNALFSSPTGIAIDSIGNLYVAEYGNSMIRKIDTNNVVTTFAGSDYGFIDGSRLESKFAQPSGLTFDNVGNLYIADNGNNRIRKISSSGVVTTIAGSNSGYLEGRGILARFNAPKKISIDLNGNLYVSDNQNHRIRKINIDGLTTTYAGSGSPAFADGNGTAASFYQPEGIDIDRNQNLYIADSRNNRIRKVNSFGVVTTIAGSEIVGNNNGIGSNATFNFPTDLDIDTIGNIFIADRGNNCIRKIDPMGIVSIYSGSGEYGYSNGVGNSVSFRGPNGIDIDREGNIFVADAGNHCIRKITPSGFVTTLAGSGSSGFNNGIGTSATFEFPNDVVVDNQGNVFVADAGNHCIRKITSEGLVTTYSGNGSGAFQDGIGPNAYFNYPRSLAIDNTGNLFVADSYNNKIRKISLNGAVTTVAGNHYNYSDGLGSAANFRFPSGIVLNSIGQLFVADSHNDLIRLLSPCIASSYPTISGDSSLCSGNTTRLTSSSPTGNLWSTGDTTQFINVSQAGSYSVRVVNSGCTSAVSAPFRVVNQGPSPTVINFDTTSNRCLGARLQLTPAGTFSYYQWNTGERSRSIYTRLSGQYSVQVANSDSCFGLPSPPIFIAFDTNWCSVEIFRIGTDSITANVWADSYIWYLDGIELLSSNTLKTIPIQGEGVYTFRAVNGGRMSTTSNPIVITSARKSLVAKFEVYPNPATNKVTVNTSGAGTLEILNTLGQVVITQPATATNELNLSLLAKGVYTVRFNGASKMLVVK